MKNLPKVELHLHLEGAAPPAFIRGLAKEKNIDISEIFDENGGYRYRDFNHFLSVYEAACTTLTGPEEFYRLTKAVLEESTEQGVIYGETFLSPDFCGGGDLTAWREYMAAIKEAADASATAGGTILRGIVTPIRHFGPEAAKPAAMCAAETVGDFITGFGIAGAEDAGEPRDFAYVFDMAREAGLELTAHAGEWRGPDHIRDTLRDLKVSRLGHGVRAAEDPALVEELAESGVMLEVCPGSNVFLGVYEKLTDHPINMFVEKGVKVSVSTDDPPFFHTTMTREYEDLASTFGWDEERFQNVNIDSMQAAFCDAATREAMIKKLKET